MLLNYAKVNALLLNKKEIFERMCVLNQNYLR